MARGNPVKTRILVKEVRAFMITENVNRAKAMKAVGARYGIQYHSMLSRFDKIDPARRQFRGTAPQYRGLGQKTIKKIKNMYDEKNIITLFVLYT